MNVLNHPEDLKGPILFSFRSKYFFGKKKAMLRVCDGEWSDKFSIDVAGSKGVVACKYNGMTYQVHDDPPPQNLSILHIFNFRSLPQVGVHNQLTYNSLTKQITFTPYYVLINNADFFIECQEADRPADPVIKVAPGGCSAFWPRSEHGQKTLKAKVQDKPEKTAPFIYTDVHTTLLKLDNKVLSSFYRDETMSSSLYVILSFQYGGINVDVQINEGGVYISMSEYNPGNAPALIINHTPFNLDLWEKGSMNIKQVTSGVIPKPFSNLFFSNPFRTIQSFNRMFYTWENPLGSRILMWEDNSKRTIEDNLRKDVLGAFQVPDLDDEIYYVTFLDGTQRVLLFTQNFKIAEDCQLTGDLDPFEQDVTLSIHGLGLSLVNNVTKSELLYMAIASSGVIWEARKSGGNRWRGVNDSEGVFIEEGYQKYTNELKVNEDTAIHRVTLDAKLEVDFLSMEMLRPHRRHLRRTFQTGLWLQYRTTSRQVQLHAKINRLQIDNQLSECVFPVILAPVAPPRSIAQSAGMRFLRG